MIARHFEFEWDEAKAASNTRKHGVAFDMASTIFGDAKLLTLADLEHSESEDRWFSIGCAANGVLLSVVYLWNDRDGVARVRLISARKATQTEIRYYQEAL